MTKRCTNCNEIKSNIEFYVDLSKKERLSAWCKKCTAQRSKKRITLYQQIMRNLKINGCAICGYNICNDALSFHHVVAEYKLFGIEQKCLSRKDNDIITELNKCILLCANCHREIHYKERKQMEKDKNENN